MKSHILSLVGYLLSNSGSLLGGGYLGYRFGGPVEAAVLALLGRVESLVKGSLSLLKK